jgi:hypothetical protein
MHVSRITIHITYIIVKGNSKLVFRRKMDCCVRIIVDPPWKFVGTLLSWFFDIQAATFCKGSFPKFLKFRFAS